MSSSLECGNNSYLFSPYFPITETEVQVAISTFSLGIFFAILNFATLVLYKRNYQRTRVRNIAVISNMFAANISFQLATSLPLFISFEKTPCWLPFTGAFTTSMCFFCLGFSGNAFFLVMTRLAICTQKFGRIPMEKILLEEERKRNLSVLLKYKENFINLKFALSFVLRFEQVKANLNPEDHIRTLLSLRYMSTFLGMALFQLILYFPFILAWLLTLLLLPELIYCYGCPIDNYVIAYASLAIGGILTLFQIFFNFKIQFLPDPWGIFQEAQLGGNICVPGFVVMIALYFTNYSNQYVTIIVPTICFGLCLFIGTAGQVLLGRYQESGKKRNINNNNKVVHTNSVATTMAGSSSKSDVVVPYDMEPFPKLYEILSRPNLLALFENFLIGEFSEENLLFLQDSATWRDSWRDLERGANYSRAKKLCNVYIAPNGLYEINISDIMKETVLNFTLETISENQFDSARKEIAQLLEIGPVERFEKTSLYTETLSNEVINNVVL